MPNMEVWKGCMNLSSEEGSLKDLRLNLPEEDSRCPSIDGASIDFLGFVDPSRIPLQLIVGSNLEFSSESEDSIEWFHDVLVRENLSGLGNHIEDIIDTPHVLWQDAGQLESNVAVLTKVTPSSTSPDEAKRISGRSIMNARVTELLFYASLPREAFTDQLATPPTSSPGPENGNANIIQRDQQRPSYSKTARIFAIPLSSDLLYQPSFHDLDPLRIGEAQFMAPLERLIGPIEGSKKRDRLGSVFDEASNRRKKARHKGGQSISLAASKSSDTIISQLRPLDGKIVKSEDDIEEASPSARNVASPNVGSLPSFSRSLGVKETSKPMRQRGTLTQTSRPVSANVDTSSSFEDTSIEAKNKQMISRIVMTAMRIYGLEQRKSGTRFRKQSIGSGTIAVPEEGLNKDGDTEYKGVYHQTYKGTLFTFRTNAATEVLQAEAVRDVVDRLLDIFCRQPP